MISYALVHASTVTQNQRAPTREPDCRPYPRAEACRLHLDRDHRIIDQQAFTRAADDIFLGSAVLFLGLIAVVWLTRPSRASGAVDTGGAH